MPEHSPAQKQYLLVSGGKIYDSRVQILLFLAFAFSGKCPPDGDGLILFIFSSPSEIWQTFFTMIRISPCLHISGITLTETLVSFVFTVFLGIGTAVLLWCCPKLSWIPEPYLVVPNSLPKSALAPLLIVWLGANIRTIIVAGMSVAIFGSIINLYTGFREADPEKLKLIRTPAAAQKKTN